ncbi:MAG: ARMT1-like domain-containing protein [Actinomycetota bacterium]|nr:ARMT1-like domain-containing protein [Actinomycetota bacterium]
MRLDAECYPCMMSQAMRAAMLSGLGGEKLLDVMRWTAGFLQELDPSTTPPAAAAVFYDRVKELSGHEDPFKLLKHESNIAAQRLLPRLLSEIDASPEPLAFALKTSIAGNIIDFGAHEAPADLESNIDMIMNHDPFIDHTDPLKNDLEVASTVLMICDNAGEIVMDRLLLEVLSSLYPNIDFTVAVRGGPAINDATLEDAREVGMEKFSRVITTGLAMAGVDLESCSPQFRSAFHNYDVIIAKGQGNFETLDQRSENIYFLFQVKCDCVSRFLGAEKYSAVLWSSRRGTQRD